MSRRRCPVIFEGDGSVIRGARRQKKKFMEWHAGDVSGNPPVLEDEARSGRRSKAETPERSWTGDSPRLLPRDGTRCPVVTEISSTSCSTGRGSSRPPTADRQDGVARAAVGGLAHELNNPASAIARGGALARRHARAGRGRRARAGRGEFGRARDRADRHHAERRLRFRARRKVGWRSSGPIAKKRWSSGSRPTAPTPPRPRASARTAFRSSRSTTWPTRVSDESLDAALRSVAAGVTTRLLRRGHRGRRHANSRSRGGNQAIHLHGQERRCANPPTSRRESPTRSPCSRLKAKAKSASGSHRHSENDLPTVGAYGGELNQVWSNLIENALDALPAQGGEIAVSARPAGRFAASWCASPTTAREFPPMSVPSIFDPFFTTKPIGAGDRAGARHQPPDRDVARRDDRSRVTARGRRNSESRCRY